MTTVSNHGGWRVVFATELRRLWRGWRGPMLLFAFSCFLSLFIVLLAADPEINVLSQRRMISLTIQVTVMVGMMAGLLLGADALSGERDQRSLESLLLTPVPRGQLVMGKLLAILSLWLAMIPIAIPYLALVGEGTGATQTSLVLLIVSGTLLVGLSSGVGVLVSGLSPTNLSSFAIAFAVMLLLAAPTQLPASVTDLPVVHWFVVANPVTALIRYQAAVIDGAAWTDQVGLLASPLVAVALVVGWGPRFLSSRLTLEGGIKT